MFVYWQSISVARDNVEYKQHKLLNSKIFLLMWTKDETWNSEYIQEVRSYTFCANTTSILSTKKFR